MTRKKLHLDLSESELAEILDVPVGRIRRNEAMLGFVEAVASAIRHAREERGWTQKRLADELGVSVGRISQYETGMLRHAPNLKALAEIAAVLRLEPRFSFHDPHASTWSGGAAGPMAGSLLRRKAV